MGKFQGRMAPVFLAAGVALTFAAGFSDCWAGDEIPFSEANLFFELNDTDGDLGIHASIDGEPWKKLRIKDPKGRKILDISVKRRLRRQGLTQLFFESAEPSFDELAPEEFFRRFPEGEYEIDFNVSNMSDRGNDGACFCRLPWCPTRHRRRRRGRSQVATAAPGIRHVIPGPSGPSASGQIPAR